jgi:hypothetical protein
MKVVNRSYIISIDMKYCLIYLKYILLSTVVKKTRVALSVMAPRSVFAYIMKCEQNLSLDCLHLSRGLFY